MMFSFADLDASSRFEMSVEKFSSQEIACKLVFRETWKHVIKSVLNQRITLEGKAMNNLNSSHQVVTHLFPARCLCAYARCPQISSIQDTSSLRSSVQLKSTAESNGISLHRQAARDDDESSFSSLFPFCQGEFGRGIVFRSQYKYPVLQTILQYMHSALRNPILVYFDPKKKYSLKPKLTFFHF